jgi:hypothetical protein
MFIRAKIFKLDDESIISRFIELFGCQTQLIHLGGNLKLLEKFLRSPTSRAFSALLSFLDLLLFAWSIIAF